MFEVQCERAASAFGADFCNSKGSRMAISLVFWLLRNFFKLHSWLLRLDIQDDQDRAKIALMGYKALVK